MIYQTYEWAHTAAAPFRVMATAMQWAFSAPINPLSHTAVGRAGAAACNVFETITRRYGKPQWHINSTLLPDGTTAPVKVQTVWHKPFCQMLHFARAGAAKRNDPKVLIVAPMSGHYATLLAGTVEAMLPTHEVYITDWADARMVPLADGTFGLSDYIDYVIEMVQFLGANTAVMAVCQPGPLVLAATALMAEDKDPATPSSIILMGSPVDPRQSPTKPNAMANEHAVSWFEDHAIDRVPLPYAGAFRRVYPGFLQLSGFMTMNLERHCNAHVELFQNLVKGDGESADKHHRFYDEYLSVMDLDADFYLQTIKVIFQDCDLPQGKMLHRGRLVRLNAIHNTAIFAIEGANDDISGIGQTKAALSLCKHVPAAKKQYYLHPEAGHYGVFNGSRWRRDIQPQVANFIKGNLL